MSQIQSFSDMSGKLNQHEINARNIDNIIQELNRNSEQLDALNNVLSVIAYGKLTYNWDGSGTGVSPTNGTLTAPINASGASYQSFIFMSRNIDSPTIYIAMPYTQIVVNGAGDTVIGKYFNSETNASTGQLQILLSFYAADTPINYTFYYIIVQQPTAT